MPYVASGFPTDTVYGVGLALQDVVGLPVGRLVHGTPVDTCSGDTPLYDGVGLYKLGVRVTSVRRENAPAIERKLSEGVSLTPVCVAVALRNVGATVTAKRVSPTRSYRQHVASVSSVNTACA